MNNCNIRDGMHSQLETKILVLKGKGFILPKWQKTTQQSLQFVQSIPLMPMEDMACLPEKKHLNTSDAKVEKTAEKYFIN